MESSNEPVNMPNNGSSSNAQILAIASIVLGIIGLCSTLFVGICGVPFPIIGLVLGYLAMKDPNQKTLAVIGLTISAITLLLGCVLLLLLGGLTVMGPIIGSVFSSINQSLTP